MGDYAKIFIMSYKQNGKWNPISDICVTRFKKQGFRVERICGYNIKEHPEIKRNEMVYRNFLDKVIPYLKKMNAHTGYFVAEDDAYPNDFVTPDFLKKRINNPKYGYKNKIVRVGYQKNLKDQRKEYPNGYMCVGNQLNWFPAKKLLYLEMLMKTSNPQHLDGFFSKTKDIDVEVLDPHVQISKKTKYILEIEHNSLTMDRKRKGKRKSSILRNNRASKKLRFFNSQNNKPARLVSKTYSKKH